jgi:hypothetical protein
MRVEGNGADGLDPLDDRQPEGEVRNKVVVHDIHVDRIGIADALQLGFEIDEICGEDARVDAALRHAGPFAEGIQYFLLDRITRYQEFLLVRAFRIRIFLGSGFFADQGQEHGIRLVKVGPQLGCELVACLKIPWQADSVQRLSGVQQFKIVALSQHISDHSRGFRRVGRTRYVRNDAPGFHGIQCRPQQVPLQRPKVHQVLGGAAPPGLRPPPQRSQSGAGNIHQDPVKAFGVLRADFPAVSSAHFPGIPGNRGQGLADELRTVRRRFVGQQRGTPLMGDRPKERRLAAGAGTQIKPGFARPCASRACIAGP